MCWFCHLQQHGITHILNVSASCQSSHLVSDSNFLRIPVNDTHNDRLLPFFPQAFQFLGMNKNVNDLYDNSGGKLGDQRIENSFQIFISKTY